MKTYASIITLILMTLASMPTAKAQKSGTKPATLTDSVSIAFRPAQWEIDRSLGNNAAVLDSIDGRLTTVTNDSLLHLRQVTVFGGSSPDGSVKLNNELSQRRAESLFGWLDRYNQLNDVEKSFILAGRDWAGTLALASTDENLPYRNETIALLQTLVKEKEALNGEEPANSLQRLKKLRGGVPYLYLYKNIFPALRKSTLIVSYDRVISPEAAERRQTVETVEKGAVNLVDTTSNSNLAIEFVAEEGTGAQEDMTGAQEDMTGVQEYMTGVQEYTGRNFYMDIRSNMLYDALALPNIGVEFYLDKNFSIGANWLYGWWKSMPRHRFWRAYGGELNARWWFGKAAKAKPLTGHHVGVYGQAYTYDFQWGGEGEMGGKPGGNLWDRCFWAAGVEYGYSLPVARRINIDFSLGLGYTQGTYYKYKPIEGHNVWQSTHKRHYWGPTKLEIAFVWLIGNGNYNEKKGGKR